MATGIDMVSSIAQHSAYTCPDCGGVLWEINQNGFHRYRCNTAPCLYLYDLLGKQADIMEASKWVALRVMEERNSLLKRLGRQEKNEV